jgi:hypothetical protein
LSSLAENPIASAQKVVLSVVSDNWQGTDQAPRFLFLVNYACPEIIKEIREWLVETELTLQ